MDVRMPDGTVIRNVPDNITQSELNRRYAASKARTAMAMDPSEYDPASPEFQAKYGPTSGQPFGENFTAGVGKSFVDTFRGIRQLGAAAADAVLPQQQTLASLVTGERPSFSAGIQQEVDEAARLDAPLMRTGGGITGNIAGQAAQFAVPAGAVMTGAKLAPRLARGAALGAAIANTQPVTGDQSRLGNTAAGAIGGAAGEGIAAGIGRVAAGSSNKISPAVKTLADKARNKWGIPLRAEQVTQSNPMQSVSAGLDMIPFSGRDASRKAQGAAWNRALSRTIGQSDTNLRTAIDNAENALGAKYNAFLSNPIKNDAQLQSGVQRVLAEAQAELDPQQFARLEKQAQNLLAKSADGAIEGRAVYNTKKILDRLTKSTDSSLKFHAQELRGELFGAIDRSIPDAKGFSTVRTQYGNLIALRRGLRAGAEGTVTPARLASMQTRGDLKELADIGATFLKEPFGNSGTANRMFGSAIVGGSIPAAFVEPTAAVVGAGMVGGARATNALLQSPAFVNYQLGGSNALRAIMPTTNRLLPLASAAGAIASQ
jgi:hypothetical protein